jgi:hypothetical protein
MTNEQRIEQLERMVAEQQRFIEDMKSANSIPREVQDGLSARLFGEGLLVPTGLASFSGSSIYNSFPVSVPSAPTGRLNVVFNGVTYGLLY